MLLESAQVDVVPVSLGKDPSIVALQLRDTKYSSKLEQVTKTFLPVQTTWIPLVVPLISAACRATTSASE